MTDRLTRVLAHLLSKTAAVRGAGARSAGAAGEVAARGTTGGTTGGTGVCSTRLLLPAGVTAAPNPLPCARSSFSVPNSPAATERTRKTQKRQPPSTRRVSGSRAAHGARLDPLYSLDSLSYPTPSPYCMCNMLSLDTQWQGLCFSSPGLPPCCQPLRHCGAA